MAFMLPVVTNDTFVAYIDMNGESMLCPIWEDGEVYRPGSEIISGKWFARLQAPGYLDCTDWAGPFDSEEEARMYLATTYCIDPFTGEDDGL